MYLKAFIEAKIYKKLSERSFQNYCFLFSSKVDKLSKRGIINLLISGFVGLFYSVDAQNLIPTGLFIAPLDIPLTLSGNFGELRTNHFHSGIDIRTNGIQGLAVKSSASGHISRIKVSVSGFGKVLYIDHPEGYTTVYAHLYQFSDTINRYIDSAQYANQSYEVELFPDSLRFPVIQGEIIGLSGNSGSSEGPHLHFEIRDRFTEEPLNPLWSGIAVIDTTTPAIKDFLFYSFKNNIWEKTNQESFFVNDNLNGPKNKIFLETDTVAMAFKSFDPDSNSYLGIYAATLMVNDSVVFHYSYNRFNFNESRYVNAHIDYKWNNKAKVKAERCFKLAGDSCSIFKNSGNGFILLNDSVPIKIELIISDFKGNNITEHFYVQKKKGSYSKNSNTKQRISFHNPFKFSTKDLSISIPSGALYQDDYFTFTNIKKPGKLDVNLLSPPFQFMDAGTPFQKAVMIKKKIKGLPDSFKGKVVLIELNAKSEIINSSLCQEDHEWYQTSIRNGGVFTYTLDTVAPTITGIGYTPNPVDSIPVLTATVFDNLTGIKTYKSYINNKWTLSAWDPKTHQLSIYPRGLIIGPNLIRIEINDVCSNSMIFETVY